MPLHRELEELQRSPIDSFGCRFLQVVCKAKKYPSIADVLIEINLPQKLDSVQKLAKALRFFAASKQNLGDLYAESGKTLQGSFSAVSKPDFTSQY